MGERSWVPEGTVQESPASCAAEDPTWDPEPTPQKVPPIVEPEPVAKPVQDRKVQDCPE